MNLFDDPVAFIRHNLLRLGDSLVTLRPEMMGIEGTIVVRLREENENDFIVSLTRNRKGLMRLMPRCYTAWWQKAANFYWIEYEPNVASQVAFPAYICAYQENTTCVQYLGEAARLMFTFVMTGCTFGVGIPKPDGGVLVGHANATEFASGNDLDADNTQARFEQRQGLVATNMSRAMVEPQNYQDQRAIPPGERDDRRASVIGVRTPSAGAAPPRGKWDFYYQIPLVSG
jgi:hypothetical protein